MLPTHDFRRTTKRLIDRYGQPTTYQKFQPGVYDENTGTVTNTFANAVSLKAHFVEVSEQEARNPALVGVDAVSVMVSYTDLPETPQIGSLVASLGETYTVLSFKSHNYGQGVAAWLLICKKG